MSTDQTPSAADRGSELTEGLGLRFNDAGLPSPFSTRPLFSTLQIEMAARAVISDYKASGDEDLDKLVRRALHDLALKFGAWIEIGA